MWFSLSTQNQSLKYSNDITQKFERFLESKKTPSFNQSTATKISDGFPKHIRNALERIPVNRQKENSFASSQNPSSTSSKYATFRSKLLYSHNGYWSRFKLSFSHCTIDDFKQYTKFPDVENKENMLLQQPCHQPPPVHLPQNPYKRSSKLENRGRGQPLDSIDLTAHRQQSNLDNEGEDSLKGVNSSAIIPVDADIQGKCPLIKFRFQEVRLGNWRRQRSHPDALGCRHEHPPILWRPRS